MLLTLAVDAFSYSERLLMVGHNPGFEEMLISVLQKEQAARTKKMATGALAIIEFPGNFRRDARDGILKHQVRGKTLPM